MTLWAVTLIKETIEYERRNNPLSDCADAQYPIVGTLDQRFRLHHFYLSLITVVLLYLASIGTDGGINFIPQLSE